LSPADWGGTIQSVPDKNEILDMMMHLRRAGDGKDPNRVDSLWLYGGLSIENTSGDRYFDFELYQTDISYDRTSKKFYGYGPDAGHTSWKFDANGKILQAGDIIFSASYQSSSLSGIEARIWIDKASMDIKPVGFNWTGAFDGASNGAQYGYAAITPNTSGIFYTGLENSRTAWAGPFKLVRADNSVVDDYVVGQYMEFSVNLTKLGIDPASISGGDVCGTPFNRMVVKTRASQSFTASLKDFIAPLDLFLSPRVNAVTDVPFYCGANGVSELKVTNPSASSVYTWYTADGNITGTNMGTNVFANAPGTYVVKQQLAEGCNPYAYDTLTIVRQTLCTVLADKAIALQANVQQERPLINWTSSMNDAVSYYELEVSNDGNAFTLLKRFDNKDQAAARLSYAYEDLPLDRTVKYYRLKLVTKSEALYSRIVSVQTKLKFGFSLAPNPASNHLTCSFEAVQEQNVQLTIYSTGGRLVYNTQLRSTKGRNTVAINEVQNWAEGVYLALLQNGTDKQWQRIIIQHPH
jgi:hypothetical protein